MGFKISMAKRPVKSDFGSASFFTLLTCDNIVIMWKA